MQDPDKEDSNYLAYIATYLFQPLLVPIYGMLLLLNQPFFYSYSATLQWFILGGSFVIAVLLPAIFYAVLRKLGIITTSQASKKEERKWAYLFTMVAYLLVAMMSLYFGVKVFYTLVWLGAFFALAIVYLINLNWKISAHATGMGGLLGACFFVSISQLINPIGLFIILFLCSGWVAWARLYLGAHTPAQLVAGYALGFFCTGILPFCYFF